MQHHTRPSNQIKSCLWRRLTQSRSSVSRHDNMNTIRAPLAAIFLKLVFLGRMGELWLVLQKFWKLCVFILQIKITLLSFLKKVKQTISSICQVKMKFLCLPRWERAWLCSVPAELHQQFTGTSKVLEIIPQSSLPCLALITITLSVENSGTTHASDWILEVVNMTWRSPIWPHQTQHFTTVSDGHQLRWKFTGLFFSVWRNQFSVCHY